MLEALLLVCSLAGIVYVLTPEDSFNIQKLNWLFKYFDSYNRT